MAKEFSTVVNQTHPGDSINGSSGNVPVNHSHFDRSLTAPNMHTVRFADYNPFFHFNAIRNDKNFRYQSSKDLRTFTFKAPLMQKVKHHQQFFSVPYESILPFQWERIFTNPVDGDDIPDDANTVIPEFGSKLEVFRGEWFQSIVDRISTDSYDEVSLTNVLKYALTFEMFLSRGSLLNSLDYKISNLYRNSAGFPTSYDGWLQSLFDWFKKNTITFNVGGESGADYVYDPSIKENSGRNDPFSVSFHRFLEILRDNLGTFSIESIVLGEGVTLDQLGAIFAPNSSSPWVILPNRRPFNYAKVCAYQLICAHFFTNDRVDYVYSADLYRQYIYGLIQPLVIAVDGYTSLNFTYNGMQLPYDYLSGAYLFYIFSFEAAQNNFEFCLSVLQALFSYNRSLRYVDYFTGAKTRPLAVGDVNVSVNQNLVNVVDVTRNIQVQRFLNAVNRFGRKFSNYLQGLFPGQAPAYDYHNPAYLMSIDSDVVTNEVENTGDAQLSEPNSVTAVLRSSGSQFVFDISLDRPSIVLGIEFFDIPRVYANNIDRSYFHVDRYDMFNPMMEYVGDQEVYKSEIDPSLEVNTLGAFGYQTRYMEFKETVGTAHGGFYEYLPGYAFIADRQNGLPSPDHISPDYIRSSCVELDPFYLSLTGDTLANYFHFIIRQDNIVSIDRPMATSPGIL